MNRNIHTRKPILTMVPQTRGLPQSRCTQKNTADHSAKISNQSTPANVYARKTYTRTVCTDKSPKNRRLTQCPVQPEGGNIASRVECKVDFVPHTPNIIEPVPCAYITPPVSPQHVGTTGKSWNGCVAARGGVQWIVDGRSEPLWGPTGSASRGS